MTTKGVATGPKQTKSLRGERATAKAEGKIRYFTGIPCVKGHIGERLTSNGSCLECCRIKDSKRPKLRHSPVVDEVNQKLLKELFSYKDGDLFWNVRMANRVYVGDAVGSVHDDEYQYKRVGILGKRYLLHKIVYMWHYGTMPNVVDHIDGNSANNRIENLRAATKSENSLNKKVRADSSTGIKNVTWYKPLKKWVVNLSVNKKRKHIGYFEDLELASLVALEAMEKFHGQFSSYSPRRM